VHLFERDCSLQRRFQKIIEEAPAPGLPVAIRDAMAAAAVTLCEHERYRGAGTVEFVVDADRFDFHFLEMNCRIQVEHPVTEMTTGTDLVAWQIDLARGKLSAVGLEPIEARGHAIECRLYAERPAKQFMPSPGPLTRLRLPAPDADLRVDTGFREGDAVTFHYDPLIAKIIARGDSRDAALDRMRAALDTVEVEGISTNAAYLAACVDHTAMRAGDVTTDFIARHHQALLG
jgi:acetyl/propionyl-CoA carboxylase alpha subunit